MTWVPTEKIPEGGLLVRRLRSEVDISTIPEALQTLVEIYGSSAWIPITEAERQGGRCTLQLTDLEDSIALAQTNGLRHAIISGGEPTIAPHLHALLPKLKSAFPDGWGIKTNGLMLSDNNLIELLVSNGMIFCELEVPDVHYAPTGDTSGELHAYDRFIAGFQNLLPHKNVALAMAFTLSQKNQHMWLEVIRRVSLWQREFGRTLSILATPLISLKDGSLLLQLRFTDIANMLRDGLRDAKKNHVSMLVHHVPLCMLENPGEVSLDWLIQDDICIQASNGNIGDLTVFGDNCESCPLQIHCPGLSESYGLRYGFDEFFPDSAQRPAPYQPRRTTREEEPSNCREHRVVISRIDDDSHLFIETGVVFEGIPKPSDDMTLTLVGPDPLVHPELGVMIEGLVSAGHRVRIETPAWNLADVDTIIDLKKKGLSGITWLITPHDWEVYRCVYPTIPNVGLRVEIFRNLMVNGLDFELAFLAIDEESSKLVARAESMMKFDEIYLAKPNAYLTTRPLYDSFEGMTRPPDPDHLLWLRLATADWLRPTPPNLCTILRIE